MKNYKYYFIFYACLISLFLLTLKFASPFNSVLYFITLLTFPIQLRLTYSVRKEILLMWKLADELKLSVSDISQLSGIGTLDLEASKESNGFTYVPKRKVIRQTIQALENKKSGL